MIVALIIVGREIAISALREWMAKVGQAASVAVAFIGKLKTVAQMVAIPLLLYHDALFGASIASGSAPILDQRRRGADRGVDALLPAQGAALRLGAQLTYNCPTAYAGIAQLVERNLAKVEVASSRLVSRSRFAGGRA